MLAVICLVEFVGPCRFSHWDDLGNPIAKAHPRSHVQVAAVTQDQTQNTMDLFPSLMSKDLIRDYGIKPGIELIRADRGRKKLRAVTSNPRALEGNRVTFAVLNETHHWVQANQGMKMYEVIDGNTTKGMSRYLAITNAYLPGEESVAETIRNAYEDYLDGKAEGDDILYDTIEANERTPLTREALEIVLPIIRGDAVWLNPEGIISSVLNPAIDPSRSRRMWLNQIVAESDQLHSPDQWKTYLNPGAELAPGDSIVLGMDGGKTDDATVLVAIRESDNTAFLLGHWEAPDGPRGEGWVVPQHEVDAAVAEAHRLYTVLAFHSDVYLWESWISQWDFKYSEQYAVRSPLGKDAIGWDMRTSLKTSTEAHERLLSALRTGHLLHDGDIILRRHALNSVRRNTPWGVYFDKRHRESKRKVDGYAALLLAHEALTNYRSRGKREVKKSKKGYWL